MKRIGDLNFKKFTGKEETNSSSRLSFEDLMSSKEPGRGSGTKFIDLSGHQILNAIGSVLPVLEGRDSEVVVYRDHFSHPGYVTKLSQFDTRSQLLTPETPITELCFERFIALIDILPGIDGLRQRLAIKYESTGVVEAVLGLNVDICSNFNIFGGGEYRLSTSKRNGVDFDKFMEKIQEWMQKAQEKFRMDLDTIRRLARCQVADFEVKEILGGLLTGYYENPTEPILNITEISRMAAKVVSDPPKTLWDVTNHGTLQVRFDSGDSEFDRIERFNAFILDYADRMPIPAETVETTNHPEISSPLQLVNS